MRIQDGEGRPEVKIQSNRNMVKQTAENGQKIPGDNDVAGITSLVPSVKNLRLRNGLEFDKP